MTVPLSELAIGKGAVVEKIKSPIGERLSELGLIDGTYVECVMYSPLSDPIAYNIRGAVIAIRKKDCDEIVVRTV